MIVPTPVTPLIVNAVVSDVSTIASIKVGYETVKLVTFAGTVKNPAISVTPFVNNGDAAVKSTPMVAVVPVNANG
jgi:hypothetical protein